ncbi:hypothetical protein [Rickettsia endosymbiont of Orchestes rusci]|uniref:hypothetical protein n=1 Tax=Rickettsia endosymbiont of Orchestes rusci TaxID=3066250 RepID=UPI00313D8EDD
MFDVIPVKTGIQKKHFYVILNLFQDLLMRCAKLVQHDKKSLDSRLHGNDIENSSHATTQVQATR